MDRSATTLIALGGLLLLGLLTDVIGKRTPLPRVTLLIVLGYAAGPEGFGLLPEALQESSYLLTKIALVMVGFLMGGQFTLQTLRRRGSEIFWISASVVLVTTFIVTLSLMACGVPPAVAILMGAIATATDPAATTDVVTESSSKSSFSKTLLGVVAVDDAWGIIAFSLCLSAALTFIGSDGDSSPVWDAAYELGGAILLGVAIGLPSAWMTGRVKSGEPSLTEALGIVLLCGGLALWLDVSWLLASITLGAFVTNFARHHKRPFHEIEHIEWPFMILFFIFAGASLEISALSGVQMIAMVYVGARVVGRLVGGWLGGFFGGSPDKTRRWIGFAMLPQAGVALGLALVAVERIPDAEQTILPVIVATTVIFELVGPICTRMAVQRTNTDL